MPSECPLPFCPQHSCHNSEGYLIHGGGYGHGCGLSQNGAMKMAEMGKSYDEILAYFFSDSNIVKE